jgi:hypothetical protein
MTGKTPLNGQDAKTKSFRNSAVAFLVTWR